MTSCVQHRADLVREIHSDPVLFKVVEGLVLAAYGHDASWEDQVTLDYIRRRGGDQAVERYRTLIRDEERLVEIAQLLRISGGA